MWEEYLLLIHKLEISVWFNFTENMNVVWMAKAD